MRQSSQPGTLALSVKLESWSSSGSRCGSTGNLIGVQHYLIEAAERSGGGGAGVRLESSDFVFDNLPALLAHYCGCCDELPVQLALPPALRACADRSSLTALSLLGKRKHLQLVGS